MAPRGPRTPTPTRTRRTSWPGGTSRSGATTPATTWPTSCITSTNWPTARLDLATVQLAAWFHDAVYRPDRSENEERSAALAERALPELGVDAARTAEVARLVRLTITHDPAPEDLDGAVLCDADLAVLAGSPEGYAAYAAAVRDEYAFVPDPDFVVGRSAVLRQLLSLPRLFSTPRGVRLVGAHRPPQPGHRTRPAERLSSWPGWAGACGADLHGSPGVAPARAVTSSAWRSHDGRHRAAMSTGATWARSPAPAAPRGNVSGFTTVGCCHACSFRTRPHAHSRLRPRPVRLRARHERIHALRHPPAARP